MLKVVDDA